MSQQNSVKSETSLDLIESCLNQIYTVRRSLLTRRSRQFEAQINQQKKKIEDDISSAASSPAKMSRILTEENVEEDSDEKLIQELKASYSLSRRPITPGSTKLPTSKPSTPSSGSIRPNESVTIIKNNDVKDIYERFLKDWEKALNSLDPSSIECADGDQQVEDICNSLMEMYLTHTLDKMDQTPEVSRVKQDIATMIEDLASSDNMTEAIARAKTTKQNLLVSVDPVGLTVSNEDSVSQGKHKALVTTENKVKKQEPVHQTSAAADTYTSSVVNKGTNVAKKQKGSVKFDETATIAPADSAPQADRKSMEKLKIKSQYEAYVNSKKKSSVTAFDNKQIEQYESLASDIKSVIDSIKK